MTIKPLSPAADTDPHAMAETRSARWDYWLALPFLGLIRLYQRTLSGLLPPACRFTPSCSHYAADALQKHRLAKALALTTWRLLRCQPLCAGGCDPVPPGPWQGRWRTSAPAVLPTRLSREIPQ